MEKSETLPYLEPLPYEGFSMAVSLLVLIALIITIVYSAKQGGIKEVIENVFLWFLLAFGVSQVTLYPVDVDDEMTAGIFFMAFGLCRIAKSIARKSDA